MKREKLILTTFAISFFAFLLAYFLFFASVGSRHLDFVPPKKGFVPDEKTAIKIAEAVWLPIFGEKVFDYKPFHAKLVNDSVWDVYGLSKRIPNVVSLGGCPIIKIQKKDGKILEVNISK